MSPQSAALALDDSTLDVDQVENLIKFCPTKEEMELLKVHTQHLSIISFNYLSDLFCPSFFLFICFIYYGGRGTLVTRKTLESVSR